MAWDSSRPVPWQRLIREWLIYVAVMGALFLIFFRDRSMIGVFGGLFISGPLYLAIGAVLAKLGYQRKSFKEMKSETAATSKSSKSPENTDPEGIAGPRPKPAPTRRTGGVPNHKKKGKRR